ncbi:DUF6801 domain-containing protein [Streptomyces sp. TS71-3]|uniref:DUF6801 domain-containing protein n=1 Tax=Streptomyces sp. TS71-3 TaxID=2733862 RepID=UPI001BB3D005|nr:DUF6801 domain-containing protein [Streptomyces sp. TS71-3]
MGVLGAGTAVSVPVSLDLNYTCTYPVINDHPLGVKINTNLSKTHIVGRPTPGYPINAVGTVDGGTTQALGLVSVKTVEGTADARIHVDAPGSGSNQTVSLNVARTPVPASGPFDIRTSGIAPSVTFTRPGNGRIMVDDLTLHLIGRNANGDQVNQGSLNAPCRLDPGQNNQLLSFAIKEPPAPTHPTGPTTPGSGTAPSASGAATGSPSGSLPGTSASASAGAGAHGTHSTPSRAPGGSTASAEPEPDPAAGGSDRAQASGDAVGGWDTADLILVVGGGLVAVAAALYAGSLFLKRRGAGGGS